MVLKIQYLPHCLSQSNASGSCCLGTCSVQAGYRTQNHLYLQSTLRVKSICVLYMCMCTWMLTLTVHCVALNETFVLLQATGRIGNVRPDVVVQVPAHVLI